MDKKKYVFLGLPTVVLPAVYYAYLHDFCLQTRSSKRATCFYVISVSFYVVNYCTYHRSPAVNSRLSPILLPSNSLPHPKSFTKLDGGTLQQTFIQKKSVPPINVRTENIIIFGIKVVYIVFVQPRTISISSFFMFWKRILYVFNY